MTTVSSLLTHTIPHVSLLGRSLKVLRIYTPLIPAAVVNH
jgi:hypothetical protein